VNAYGSLFIALILYIAFLAASASVGAYIQSQDLMLYGTMMVSTVRFGSLSPTINI
jgi:hypothetical protein